MPPEPIGGITPNSGFKRCIDLAHNRLEWPPFASSENCNSVTDLDAPPTGASPVTDRRVQGALITLSKQGGCRSGRALTPKKGNAQTLPAGMLVCQKSHCRCRVAHGAPQGSRFGAPFEKQTLRARAEVLHQSVESGLAQAPIRAGKLKI